jgi:hypothetical protein
MELSLFKTPFLLFFLIFTPLHHCAVVPLHLLLDRLQAVRNIRDPGILIEGDDIAAF